MYPVYLITCSHPSYGQHIMPYVGVILTKKTIEDRFREHCVGVRRYLSSAIQKHGKKWFQVEQIDAGNAPEQAKELEKFWIRKLGTKAPNGYNLTDGGDGLVGHVPSPETRAKMRSAMLGKKMPPRTEEQRQHMREVKLGTRASEDTKRKMSRSQTGRKHTPESRERMSSWQIGRKATAEFRARLSVAHIGIQSGSNNPNYGNHKPWSAARRAAQERGVKEQTNE